MTSGGQESHPPSVPPAGRGDGNEGSAIAYTDGSCIGNPGPGGWGVHLEYPDGGVLELGGGELETTNNRMELRAAIEALRVTVGYPSVRILTDSSYLRSGVTKWLPAWKAGGWQTARKKAVENQALWQELDALADERVIWEWTRAHVGTPGNERADRIAYWFATGVARLRPSAARSYGSAPRAGTHYLSLVDGIPARHATWAECERRVHGVRGARFRKARSPDEEREILESWGLPPDTLVEESS